MYVLKTQYSWNNNSNFPGNPQPGRAPPSKTEVRYTAETVSDEPAVNEYTADPAPSGSTADPADVMLRENPNDYAVITG